ncbi:alpha/beta fold hydrolase [Candidatus Latescibacterota bacterium]
MPKIHINNVELHYEEYGTGGTPVVLVHGFLASSNMWRDYFIPHLYGSHRVYALDMRGHGQSSHVKQGCNVVQLADDVFQFVQEMQLENVIYIGMSMGGAVGIQFAINHPDCFGALIVMNTGFGSPLSKDSSLVTTLVGLMAKRRWLLRKFINKVFARPPRPEMIQDFLDDAVLVSKDTWIEYIHHSNKIARYELLNNFNAPALILIGGKDTVSPFEQQNDLVELIPHATRIILENEGHAMFLENPEAVFNEIALFLEKNSL